MKWLKLIRCIKNDVIQKLWPLIICMVRVRFCCSHMLNRELLFFQLSHFPLLWKQVDRCQLKHNLTCTDWSKVTFTNWYEQYCLFIREANSWGLIITLPGPTIKDILNLQQTNYTLFFTFRGLKGKKNACFSLFVLTKSISLLEIIQVLWKQLWQICDVWLFIYFIIKIQDKYPNFLHWIVAGFSYRLFIKTYTVSGVFGGTDGHILSYRFNELG